MLLCIPTEHGYRYFLRDPKVKSIAVFDSAPWDSGPSSSINITLTEFKRALNSELNRMLEIRVAHVWCQLSVDHDGVGDIG